MTDCRRFRGRLAELADPLDRETAAHLENCGRCRREHDALRAVLDELRVTESGPDDAPMLAEIRREVLARLGRGRWMGGLRWAAACIGAVAGPAALAVALQWPAGPSGPRPAPVALTPPTPPRDVLSPSRRPPPSSEPRESRRERTPAIGIEIASKPEVAADPEAELMLELESRNPDVVIYWLMEPTGD